jgi:hypothetical protein
MHWNDNPRGGFDPLGNWFVYTGDFHEGRLTIMRVSDFKEMGKTPPGMVNISPSGMEFGGSYLYLKPGSKPSVLPMQEAGLGSASQYSIFSPNGKYVAWGTESGLVIVADIEEVRRLLSGL